MLKFLLSALTLFITPLLWAQVSQQWVQRYTTINYDYSTVVKTDASGNVYVLGTTNGYTTSGNIALVKYNSAGTQLWATFYNSPYSNADLGMAMTLDAAGNIYVTGRSTVPINNGTSSEIVTIKFNSSGVRQWATRYFRPDGWPSSGEAVAVDASGNVYVAGYTLTDAFAYDYITVKYNSSGVQQWLKTYNGTNNGVDWAHFIGLDASGNVYVCGESDGLTTRRLLDRIITIKTGYDYFTIKYDNNGNEVWQRRYNAHSGNDRPHGMAVDAAGTVYITGECYVSSTNYDYLTVKYTTDGTLQWATKYGGAANGYDMAYGLSVDGSGNVFVTGGGDAGGNVHDYVTIKYNSSGVQQWLAAYNSPTNGNDIARAIALDAYGSIYVTGQSANDYLTVKYTSGAVQSWAARYNGPGNSTDDAVSLAVYNSSGPEFSLPNVYVTGNSTGNGTYYDITTVKYTQPIVIGGFTTERTMLEQMQLYSWKLSASPNPARSLSRIMYEVADDSYVTVEVYDMIGRKVSVLFSGEKVKGKYQAEFNSSRLSKGVYTCRMIANTGKEYIQKNISVVLEK